jgi:hypothetical protein
MIHLDERKYKKTIPYMTFALPEILEKDINEYTQSFR